MKTARKRYAAVGASKRKQMRNVGGMATRKTGKGTSEIRELVKSYGMNCEKIDHSSEGPSEVELMFEFALGYQFSVLCMFFRKVDIWAGHIYG